MNEDVDHISFLNLIQGDLWNHDNLSHFFGSNFDLDALKLGSIDSASDNHYIRNPKTGNHKLTAAVYHHLNHSSTLLDGWHGWNLIWHIFIAPRVKHFLWLLIHGRLSTLDFLIS